MRDVGDEIGARGVELFGCGDVLGNQQGLVFVESGAGDEYVADAVGGVYRDADFR